MNRPFSGPGTSENSIRSDSDVVTVELGNLYFNHALVQIKSGHYSFAQQDLARAQMFLPKSIEVVLLKLKVAVIQNDYTAAGLYLQSLREMGVREEKADVLRRRIAQVRFFRFALPVYGVGEPLLRLIRLIIWLFYKLVWMIGVSIAQFAKGVAYVATKMWSSIANRSNRHLAEKTGEADTDMSTSDEDSSEESPADDSTTETSTSDEDSSEEISADDSTTETSTSDEDSSEESPADDSTTETSTSDEDSSEEISADDSTTETSTSDEDSSEEISADDSTTETSTSDEDSSEEISADDSKKDSADNSPETEGDSDQAGDEANLERAGDETTTGQDSDDQPDENQSKPSDSSTSTNK
jgi:hypothetical protein